MSERKQKPRRGKKKVQQARKAQRKPKGTKRRSFNVVRLGQRVGKLFAGRSGGMVGAEAGRLFRKLTGFGDYKVNSNTLMPGSTDRLPAFINNRAGTRIQHREYLFDVVTSASIGAFSVEEVPIQPALLSSFPWLSASGEQYQEYTINGMVYEFKSNSYNALASTNTASGTVIMTTNYNTLDPPFTTKFQMEQSQFTCSAKPSVDLLHPIECSKIETPTSVLYTRAGPGALGDLRLYDWGTFNLATVGMQGASTNIGELWVTYDITLFKPKLGSAVDVSDHYLLPLANVTVNGPAYFGGTAHPPILTSQSDMGTTLTSTAGGGNLDTINWPPGYTGKVLVMYALCAPTAASLVLATAYNLTFVGGVSPLNGFSALNDNNQLLANCVYNDTGSVTFVFMLNISNGGSVFLTGGGTTGPAFTTADLVITALPTGFV